MIVKEKLKELEDWMNGIFATHDKTRIYLTGFINNAVYELLKKNPDVSKLKLADSAKALNCVKAKSVYDAYPSDVSVQKFNTWLQTYPEFKERWDDLYSFLNEIKKYAPSDVDGYVDCAVDFINTHEKIHLHKPGVLNGSPYSMLKMDLSEDFFVQSEGEQGNILLENLPLCLGIHNNRCIFVIDEYVVGCTFTDMAKKFSVLRKRKKHVVDCPTTDKESNILTELIFNITYEIDRRLKRRAAYPQIITFEAVNDTSLPENISTKIKNLWDEELHIIDVRTNTPLTENYMTMLGYLFAPTNKNERVCMSFYSTASGFGKTSFIERICERIDVNLQELACSAGKANQFTFSYAIAKGPDILKADDPMKSTEDVLGLVSRLVSDHAAPCELKGGEVKTVKDLYTKVLITSNVPLYMKNDNNNFLTEKLFELRTNEIEHCSNDQRVADINTYIETCSDGEINNFLTKCINMYLSNPEWLERHKGQYQDKDEIECKFSLIDPSKLKDTHNKTLLECKREDVYGYDEIRHQAYNDIQTQWNIMCKYIKTTWAKLADTCKCMVPLNSYIYSPSTKIAANKFKNYTLNDELRAKIMECVNNDEGAKAQENTCGTQATYDPSHYDDLFGI